MNAVAASRPSRMSTPTSATPRALVAWLVASSSGASARHGAHQEPQKFTTITLPRSEPRSNGVPSSSSPDTAGAGLRAAAGNTSTVPAPAAFCGPEAVDDPAGEHAPSLRPSIESTLDTIPPTLLRSLGDSVESVGCEG